jgi:hypothetical protein
MVEGKQIRKPKPEILTWRSQTKQNRKRTAEHAEYAEKVGFSPCFRVFRVFRGLKIEAILRAI